MIILHTSKKACAGHVVCKRFAGTEHRKLAKAKNSASQIKYGNIESLSVTATNWIESSLLEGEE